MTMTRLRSLAYDVVTRRDGLAGWKPHRRRFRTLSRSGPREIERHALDALRRLLVHAYATAPYYRETWKAAGFVPSLTTTVEDVRRLPLVTKRELRERKMDFVSERFDPAALRLDYTGGTTGVQTAFYRDTGCSVARFGRQWGVLERCGYRPGDKRALIWGAHADLRPPDATGRLKQRFRQFSCAEAVACCTVMRREEMLGYHRRLQAFRPSVLYGYPNAIEQFARFIDREGLARVRVARVICTAETLRPSQRALFQERFGGEVFNLYCSREHGCVGFECERHDGFHVDAGSVLVEILRSGRAAHPGESGEIVTTDLLNYGMPLIRYATGDLAMPSSSPCVCGCALPTFSALHGRVADTLYRADGTPVAGLMLTDLFWEQPSITDAQFVQSDIASLDVHVVLQPGAPATIREDIVNEVRSIMGTQIAIRVRVVADIPRNPTSGKYQEVVCAVPAQTLAALASEGIL